MSDSKIPRTYDLSVGLRNLDGDPITVLSLLMGGSLAPTQSEMDEAEERAGSDPEHEGEGIAPRHFSESVRKDPCPAWRLVRHCLLTQQKRSKIKEGKVVEEDLPESTKRELYEMALMITNEVRQGTIDEFKMLPAQAALCQNACAKLPIQLHGLVRQALTPVDDGES